MTGQEYTLIQNTYENGWKLTPEHLEAHLKKAGDSKRKVLILNYPNNPVGNTYCEDEVKAIAAVCDTYKTTIISDEIYGLIDHSGSHVSTAKYSNHAIISSGISKWAGAGGWRLGYMAFPAAHEKTLADMRTMVSETYTSVSAPIQYAAIEAFKASDSVDRYLANTRRVLKTVAKKVKATFSDIPELKLSEMDGGFYFFMDFSAYRKSLASLKIHTSVDLADHLLEKYSIAALPGVCFGRGEEELSMRFAYIDFNGAYFIAMDIEDLKEEFILSRMENLILGLEKLEYFIVNL
jgi:aspartate aminotransferase